MPTIPQDTPLSVRWRGDNPLGDTATPGQFVVGAAGAIHLGLGDGSFLPCGGEPNAPASLSVLKFKGYISTAAPTINVQEGMLWVDSNTFGFGWDVDPNFPWQVKTYTNGAWSATTTAYTAEPFDLWSRLDNGNDYYWRQGQYSEWTQLNFRANSIHFDAPFRTQNQYGATRVFIESISAGLVQFGDYPAPAAGTIPTIGSYGTLTASDVTLADIAAQKAQRIDTVQYGEFFTHLGVLSDQPNKSPYVMPQAVLNGIASYGYGSNVPPFVDTTGDTVIMVVSNGKDVYDDAVRYYVTATNLESGETWECCYGRYVFLMDWKRTDIKAASLYTRLPPPDGRSLVQQIMEAGIGKWFISNSDTDSYPLGDIPYRQSYGSGDMLLDVTTVYQNNEPYGYDMLLRPYQQAFSFHNRLWFGQTAFDRPWVLHTGTWYNGTEEVAVGVWTNFGTVYQKTFYRAVPAIPQANTWTFLANAADLIPGVSDIVSGETHGMLAPMSFRHNYNNSTIEVWCSAEQSADYGQFTLRYLKSQ